MKCNWPTGPDTSCGNEGVQFFRTFEDNVMCRCGEHFMGNDLRGTFLREITLEEAIMLDVMGS